MEQIKVQYTNPSDGTNVFDFFKFELSKFRSDASVQPNEEFFLNCDATGVITKRQIPVVAEAAIAANPFNPFGVSDVAFGLVATKALSNATSVDLVKDAATLGFANGDTVAFLATPTSAPLAVAKVTTVSGVTLNFGSALGVAVNENAIVVKMVIPQVFVAGFTAQNETWGAKTLLEAPGKPTIAAGNITIDPYSVATIEVTLTAATTKNYVTKEFNIFVMNSTELFDPKAPFIPANRKADAVLTAAGIASVTTWGGGANAGGGDIMDNGTYYVVAIAKDSTNKVGANCSGLSNIVTVTP